MHIALPTIRLDDTVVEFRVGLAKQTTAVSRDFCSTAIRTLSARDPVAEAQAAAQRFNDCQRLIECLEAELAATRTAVAVLDGQDYAKGSPHPLIAAAEELAGLASVLREHKLRAADTSAAQSALEELADAMDNELTVAKSRRDALREHTERLSLNALVTKGADMGALFDAGVKLPKRYKVARQLLKKLPNVGAVTGDCYERDPDSVAANYLAHIINESLQAETQAHKAAIRRQQELERDQDIKAIRRELKEAATDG